MTAALRTEQLTLAYDRHVVVRELGVAIPEQWRARALDWLEHEEIEWEEATARRLRRQKEMALLGPRAGG